MTQPPVSAPAGGHEDAMRGDAPPAPLREVIEATVRERLTSIPIAEITVEEGTDRDGDPALFLRVVFDGAVEDLDIGRVNGLTRHLRARLRIIGEERFPHARFQFAADIEGAAA